MLSRWINKWALIEIFFLLGFVFGFTSFFFLLVCWLSLIFWFSLSAIQARMRLWPTQQNTFDSPSTYLFGIFSSFPLLARNRARCESIRLVITNLKLFCVWRLCALLFFSEFYWISCRQSTYNRTEKMFDINSLPRLYHVLRCCCVGRSSSKHNRIGLEPLPCVCLPLWSGGLAPHTNWMKSDFQLMEIPAHWKLININIAHIHMWENLQ